MIIIPLTGKISRKNPPIFTISVIIINCLIFFIFQSGDAAQYNRAMSFYFDSGLANIETTAYLEYLEAKGKSPDSPNHYKGQGAERARLVRIWKEMQNDETFITKLLKGQIITQEEKNYRQWRDLRKRYNEMLSGILSWSHGFIPAKAGLQTSFTYMFLHGSFVHLLGNMVFLWLVGCVIELGCGRPLYLSIYLISGILSAWLFWLVYQQSVMPLVGASGAISGLIGAYTVLYGRRKVRIFYSLGFYFNYAKITAIFLLPLWIANEFFQMFFGDVNQVAYIAHIGGLATGALLGYANLKFLGMFDQEVFEEKPRERIASMLEEALGYMERLDMASARILFEKVLEIDPGNKNALTHLFDIDKLEPESDLFHNTAARLLHILSRNKGNHEDLYQKFKEYRNTSKPIRLSPTLLLRISSVFCATGHLEESEKILSALLRKKPQLKPIPSSLLNLARAYLNTGMVERGQDCLQLLSKNYPHSPEKQIAKRLLKKGLT